MPLRRARPRGRSVVLADARASTRSALMRGERVHDLVAQPAAEIIEAGAAGCRRPAATPPRCCGRPASPSAIASRPALRRAAETPARSRLSADRRSAHRCCLHRGNSGRVACAAGGLHATIGSVRGSNDGSLPKTCTPMTYSLRSPPRPATVSLDDEADEALEAFDLREGLAAENPAQLLADDLVRQLGRRESRGARGHQPMVAHSRRRG